MYVFAESFCTESREYLTGSIVSDDIAMTLRDRVALLPFDPGANLNGADRFQKRHYGAGEPLQGARVMPGPVLYLERASKVFWVAKLATMGQSPKPRATITASCDTTQHGAGLIRFTSGDASVPTRIDGEMPAAGLVRGWFGSLVATPGFTGVGLYCAEAVDLKVVWIAFSRIRGNG